MRTHVDYPLMRELQQMGILTAETVPQLIGPFKTMTEAFSGDTSGNTDTLAQTPVGSIIFCVAWTTANTEVNTPVVLVEDTHFSVSGTTLTYLSDQSAVDVLVHYAY